MTPLRAHFLACFCAGGAKSVADLNNRTIDVRVAARSVLGLPSPRHGRRPASLLVEAAALAPAEPEPDADLSAADFERFIEKRAEFEGEGQKALAEGLVAVVRANIDDAHKAMPGVYALTDLGATHAWLVLQTSREAARRQETGLAFVELPAGGKP